MTEEAAPREVSVIFGWCTTGQCEECPTWTPWTTCVYVCSHSCHEGKERPPLPKFDPPWDAQPKKKAARKPPVKKAKPLTPEEGQDMIPSDEPADDGSETREQT
jgi:hypothetical protein